MNQPLFHLVRLAVPVVLDKDNVPKFCDILIALVDSAGYLMAAYMVYMYFCAGATRTRSTHLPEIIFHSKS